MVCSCADLKFMLLAAMHGDILAQTSAREPEVRRHTLQSAIKLYSRWQRICPAVCPLSQAPYTVSLLLCSFLNMCNQYGLLSEDAKAAARLDGQQPLDQNTRRLQKVQRFKREREIKAKLSSTQMRQMRIAQLQDEVVVLRNHTSSLY